MYCDIVCGLVAEEERREVRVGIDRIIPRDFGDVFGLKDEDGQEGFSSVEPSFWGGFFCKLCSKFTDHLTSCCVTIYGCA